MGKTSRGAEVKTLSSTKSSKESQNQGFLKFFGKKAAHDQLVAGPGKNRKGFKSGESLSFNNFINQSAQKGRK
jgi:hypothetical protein